MLNGKEIKFAFHFVFSNTIEISLVLSGEASFTLASIYSLASFILLIVCVVKYFKLKKEKKYNREENIRREKPIEQVLGENVANTETNEYRFALIK